MGRRVDTDAQARVDAVFAAAFPPGASEWIPAREMALRLALAGATDWQARRGCARWRIARRKAGPGGPWLWLPETELLHTTRVHGQPLMTERLWHETRFQHAARHRERWRAATGRRPMGATTCAPTAGRAAA